MLWLAEVANFVLILAFVLSLVLWLLPVLHFAFKKYANSNFSKKLAKTQNHSQNLNLDPNTNQNTNFKIKPIEFLFIGLFLCLSATQVLLAIGFILDDFSIEYVAENSSSLLNWYFKLSAIWGGHQGSLLFWVFLISLFGFVFIVLDRNFTNSENSENTQKIKPQVLAFIGFVIFGFLAYVIFLGNPFARLFPFIPYQGADLNPMLQDIGLIFHPPLLYLGYAGLVLSFAISASLLLSDATQNPFYLQKLQNSLQFAWIFLTLGIALGSFWAYYELGWGGWWFWDQVENSSLIPWLLLTFSLHSGKLALKRHYLFDLHIFFVLLAFIASLLGNFLVRSGILSSVHSFAVSPTKGKFILFLIFVLSALSMILFLLKAKSINKVEKIGKSEKIEQAKKIEKVEKFKESEKGNGAYSKNILTLENLLFFSLGIIGILAASVALGTWYPIILQALNLGDISVGAPYFNSFFVPLVLVLAFLLGLGFLVNLRTKFNNRKKYLIYVAIFCLSAIGFLLQFIWVNSFQLILGISLSLMLWVFAVLLLELFYLFWNKNPADKSAQKRATSKKAKNYMARHLAHIGFIFAILGASVSSVGGDSEDIAITQGKGIAKFGFVFLLQGMEEKRESNYLAEVAHIDIFKDGKKISQLNPERRIYFNSRMPMVETAIDRTLWRDIYLALGENISHKTYALKIEYKPMINFLWLGALLMALGALLARLSAIRFFRSK